MLKSTWKNHGRYHNASNSSYLLGQNVQNYFCVRTNSWPTWNMQKKREMKFQHHSHSVCKAILCVLNEQRIYKLLHSQNHNILCAVARGKAIMDIVSGNGWENSKAFIVLYMIVLHDYRLLCLLYIELAHGATLITNQKSIRQICNEYKQKQFSIARGVCIFVNFLDSYTHSKLSSLRLRT